MADLPDELARDVQAIGRVDAVPTLLRVLCDTTGMGFAVVARVSEGAWTACAVRDTIGFGLQPGGQLDIDTTLCKEVRAARTPIVIQHASDDEVYCKHQTPRLYAFESYISVPIELSNGEYFGNLCAIDPKPAQALAETRILEMFQLFAQLIALQLENDRKQERARTELIDERAASELREQFIAVLGHDLRNPLSAVSVGAELLQRRPHDASLVMQTAARIERSVKRMSVLIDDVLDFARGRLGGGIGIALNRVDDLGDALAGVLADMQAVHQDRAIDIQIDITGPVLCDRGRIQQLACNLLANALTHGSAQAPVKFKAVTQGDDLVVQTLNDGEPIPAENLDKVFAPFWRQSASGHRQGLGLGLYICSQIVKAHRGQLSASSTREGGTTFTARIPL